MYYWWILYSLCFFLVSSSITYQGDTYEILKWSEVPFPSNFSLSLNVSVTTACILTTPPATKKAALALISQYIGTSVKGILIPAIPDDFKMDWIRDNNIVKGSIPVGLLIIPSYSAFKAKMGNSSVYVQFDGWGLNYPYELSRTYGIATRSIDIILIICCFLWANWKIIGLIRDKQFDLNIAPVCLCIEVMFNLLRLVRSSLLLHENTAPVPGSIMPDNLTLSIYALSFSCNLSSGIFIIFFWMNLMKLKLYKIGLLDKAFWPSFALVAMVFILVVIFASLIIGKPGQNTIITIIGSLFVSLNFFVAVLYFIIAYQVFRYTENRTGSSDIKIIAIKIVLSGICFFLIVCFSINQLTTRGRFFLVHTAGFFIMDLLYSVRSFLQIDVFGTIKKKNQEVVVMDEKNVSSNTPTLPNTS